MDIKIKIKDGFKLEAELEGHIINSDQAKEAGGLGTAPNPFEYFLTSTGLCVAHYVNAFCKQRDIDSTKIEVLENVTRNSDGELKFTFKIKTPADFPEKYKEAVIKAASGCAVKKAIQGSPIFEVHVE